MREKVEFVSGEHKLSGLLESPESDVKFYALFAYCFACGKDIATASRISRATWTPRCQAIAFSLTRRSDSSSTFGV